MKIGTMVIEEMWKLYINIYVLYSVIGETWVNTQNSFKKLIWISHNGDRGEI